MEKGIIRSEEAVSTKFLSRDDTHFIINKFGMNLSKTLFTVGNDQYD